MRKSTLISLVSLVICSCGLVRAEPNIVIIFTDDMGYGDMSCNGHPTLRTPNLDRMATEGQKWTSFYVAACVCTPSRAGLMTGRLPVRSGMCSSKRRVLFPDSKGGLPAKEHTLAEMLKSRGYATGMVGKWHLGHLPQYLPTNNGFDSWYGIPYSNDMDADHERIKEVNATNGRGDHWQNPRSEYWNVPLMEGEKILMRSPDQELLTKTYTERSIEFIRANKQRPFFLYLAHSMPHVPLFRSEKFKNRSTAGIYGDVIEEIDWSVGEVLKTLRDEGIADNTLVLFTSDNGPWTRFKTLGGIAGPLRGGKGSTWEGGMREPTIFWWPGSIKPGIVHDLGSTLDIKATLASLTGAELIEEQRDSYDLSATLLHGAPSPRKEMFFYRGVELFAVRHGSYKLHYSTQSGYKNDRVDYEKPLLYNLDMDPGENYDIADENPEIIADINRIRDAHQATLKPVENQLEKK